MSPGAGCLRESQSTLAFAQRAKQIRNRAVVNEDTHGELAALTKENGRLRRELRLLNDTCRALQQVRFACAMRHRTCFHKASAGYNPDAHMHTVVTRISIEVLSIPSNWGQTYLIVPACKHASPQRATGRPARGGTGSRACNCGRGMERQAGGGAGAVP